MASRIWLLVEWVDESDVFPVYSVVNVDTMAYGENDLQPGNLIFICVKRENPRRAKILRVSENKRYLKERKEILERQDLQVKNVLQLCMRTIKDMKSEPAFAQLNTSNNSTLPQVFVAHGDSSSSDSDSETKSHISRNRVKNFNSQDAKYGSNIHYSRTSKQNHPHQRALSSGNYSRRSSILCSTPLPRSVVQETIKLCLDQATQTENIYLQPPLSKIEEMETVLRNLYGRFQALLTDVNFNTNGSISESEHNDDNSYDIDPTIGELWAENNVEYNEQEPPRYILEGHDVNTEHMDETGEQNNVNETTLSNPKVKNEHNLSSLRVRKMPAQTTNNIETATPSDVDLVPIGSGNAKVPTRLLNDIDWNSYTNATRQLLQAIFPRKILATHSLTGKQSPAFLNRPPKKILDPKLVDDIVKTVSTRCGVPKNLVRNSITIKCTDEAKLYRNRQRYRKSLQISGNDENAPPSTPSSDESSNVLMN